jgi:hypothetical protein
VEYNLLFDRSEMFDIIDGENSCLLVLHLSLRVTAATRHTFEPITNPPLQARSCGNAKARPEALIALTLIPERKPIFGVS